MISYDTIQYDILNILSDWIISYLDFDTVETYLVVLYPILLYFNLSYTNLTYPVLS